MHPLLFEVAGFKVYSYGFFIALGYVSALGLGRFLARSRGLNSAPFMDLAFLAIVSGVIGARILFVVTTPDYFLQHPSEVFDFWSGGLVFYGGFIVAGLACLGFGIWKKMPLALGNDIVLSGVAFAHAFGRIGCFAAGCCHGNACSYPWAIVNNTEFAEPAFRGHPIHPVQIYESVLLFVLSGVMAWIVYRRRWADGMVAAFYLTGYAAIRFVMEMFRGDSDRGYLLNGALSTSQAIALVLFLLGVGVGTFIRRFRRQDL